MPGFPGFPIVVLAETVLPPVGRMDDLIELVGSGALLEPLTGYEEFLARARGLRARMEGDAGAAPLVEGWGYYRLIGWSSPRQIVFEADWYAVPPVGMVGRPRGLLLEAEPPVGFLGAVNRRLRREPLVAAVADFPPRAAIDVLGAARRWAVRLYSLSLIREGEEPLAWSIAFEADAIRLSGWLKELPLPRMEKGGG